MNGLFDRERDDVAPGAVHVPDWLPLDRQREILRACRTWAAGPVPLRSPRLPGGGRMSVRTLSLGWHWRPYRYTRTAGDAGGARVLPMPRWLVELGAEAVVEAYGAAAEPFRADTALVNVYDEGATMGMHQDKDEIGDDPVVSLSIGDACRFRFGNTRDRGRPYRDVELRSGDLFVFGGPSRMAFHGVTAVLPGTADPDLGLDSGRINITLRRTGLGDEEGRT